MVASRIGRSRQENSRIGRFYEWSHLGLVGFRIGRSGNGRVRNSRSRIGTSTGSWHVAKMFKETLMLNMVLWKETQQEVRQHWFIYSYISAYIQTLYMYCPGLLEYIR